MLIISRLLKAAFICVINKYERSANHLGLRFVYSGEGDFMTHVLVRHPSLTGRKVFQKCRRNFWSGAIAVQNVPDVLWTPRVFASIFLLSAYKQTPTLVGLRFVYMVEAGGLYSGPSMALPLRALSRYKTFLTFCEPRGSLPQFSYFLHIKKPQPLWGWGLFIWWRRGDLNPRPPALRPRLYMLSFR